MAAIVFKAIKASRLKEKAMVRELLNGMAMSEKDILADFQSTVATWKKKPKFEVVSDLNPSGPEILVGTDDEIYGYVDRGTKPHIIRPVKAKSLVFRGNYTAKTTPRIIGSKAGGSSGPLVFSQEVRHPGTKAREFSETIQKKQQPRFKRRMEKAMSRARTESGHAI
jgi:hypothetical protein